MIYTHLVKMNRKQVRKITVKYTRLWDTLYPAVIKKKPLIHTHTQTCIGERRDL